MQAVSDLRALAAAEQPQAPCSSAERRSLLVAAAAAHAGRLRGEERKRTASAQVIARLSFDSEWGLGFRHACRPAAQHGTTAHDVFQLTLGFAAGL